MQLEQISSLLGIIIIFGLVLYGSYFVSKKIAKFSLGANQSRYMKIVDRIVLGQDRYAAIVTVGERYFLLGISGETMTLLSELSKDDMVLLEGPNKTLPETLNFKEILKKLGHDKDTES